MNNSINSHFYLRSFQSAFRQITIDVYDAFSENVDFWVKTIHTETNDTITDVWTNAYPKVQKFMDDLR